jgi:hypothetical protein
MLAPSVALPILYLRRGATEVIKYRRQRMDRLAGQALLKHTRFLVVAHPVRGEPAPEVEARRRADVISEMLRRHDIAAERITQWIYEFPVSPAEIEYPADRPAPGEPGDLTRSVWVFRADC